MFAYSSCPISVRHISISVRVDSPVAKRIQRASKMTLSSYRVTCTRPNCRSRGSCKTDAVPNRTNTGRKYMRDDMYLVSFIGPAYDNIRLQCTFEHNIGVFCSGVIECGRVTLVRCPSIAHCCCVLGEVRTRTRDRERQITIARAHYP